MRPLPFGRSLVAGVVAALLVAACSSGAVSTAQSSVAPSSGAPSASSAPSGPPTKLTVGLGYIPSVQFAQFYLADQAGYYRDEGLDVTFQNEIDANLVPKVGQGQVDIGISDGTSVIPAVSQNIPIKYVATIYGQFPSIVFGKESSGIASAADLKGKKIGIPGRYGSSWIMLQALLDSAGLTPNDVVITEYPDFGQGAAVAQGAVDAATGFANNEPVQLELAGTPVFVLHIDDITRAARTGPDRVDGDGVRQARRGRRLRPGDAQGDGRHRRQPGDRARRRDRRGAGSRAGPGDAVGHPRRDDQGLAAGRAAAAPPASWARSTARAGRPRSTT